MRVLDKNTFYVDCREPRKQSQDLSHTMLSKASAVMKGTTKVVCCIQSITLPTQNLFCRSRWFEQGLLPLKLQLQALLLTTLDPKVLHHRFRV